MSAQNNPHSTIIPFTGVRYHRGLCICGETLCVEVSKLFQSIRDLWGHKKDTLTITGGSRKDGEQVTKQLMVQRWADYLKLNLDIVKSTATYNTETKKKTNRKTKKLRTITFILIQHKSNAGRMNYTLSKKFVIDNGLLVGGYSSDDLITKDGAQEYIIMPPYSLQKAKSDVLAMINLQKIKVVNQNQILQPVILQQQQPGVQLPVLQPAPLQQALLQQPDPVVQLPALQPVVKLPIGLPEASSQVDFNKEEEPPLLQDEETMKHKREEELFIQEANDKYIKQQRLSGSKRLLSEFYGYDMVYEQTIMDPMMQINDGVVVRIPLLIGLHA